MQNKLLKFTKILIFVVIPHVKYIAEQSIDIEKKTNEYTYIPVTNHEHAPVITRKENCGNSEQNNAKNTHLLG